MNELYEKSLHKLELDKVLALLADQACSPAGKEQCLEIRAAYRRGRNPASSEADERGLPHASPSRARRDFAGCERCGRERSTGRTGADASVPEELLRVAGVLKCARQAKAYADGDGMENDLNIFFAQITPNKYLEERIFTSIVSKDEIADAASPELASIRRKIRQPERGHPRGTSKDHHVSDLRKIFAGADRDDSLRPVCRACKGRVQGLRFRVWFTTCRLPAARFSLSLCRP